MFQNLPRPWLKFVPAVEVVTRYYITISLFLLVVFAFVWLKQKLQRNRRRPEEKETKAQTKHQEEDAIETSAVELGEAPNHPHLQGCMVPFSGELLRGGRVAHFENETAVGSTVTIHRATWDPSLDKSGNYPFGYVFKGRNINWEVRVQLRFKSVPEGMLRMGIELDDFVPVTGMKKITMKAVMAALKLIVGDDLHHSVGDDPSQTSGEAERPIFSMPMWAFDQFIETPEGQSPPSLIDPGLMGMGIRRADNLSDFKWKMNNTKFRPGPTYTFSFFSISCLIDNILWKIGDAIPGVAVNFNKFCGRPPVHIAIYTVRPPPDNGEFDQRLLDSRKIYHFHLAFWSSLCQPPSWRLKQLTNSVHADDTESSPDDHNRQGFQLDSFLNCCFRYKEGSWK